MLLDNRADVMFTDDIEVEYKHKLNPNFCMAKIDLNAPITNKIFLFNNDETGKKIQQQFNAWWLSNKPSENK